MTATAASPALPHTPGTYVLLIQLRTPITLQAGRLGTYTLSAGIYAYAGSAQGPGGLHARIARHLRTPKTPHWHIDALTAAVPISALWIVESSERLECTWAHTLSAIPGVTCPIPRFGSSDCACPSHLFALPEAAIDTAWAALNRPRVVTGPF